MQPLLPNCIRVLHLEAGICPAPTCVRLRQVHFRSLPAYEALSYSWGYPTENTGLSILCDGRPFEVTRNLYEALPYLRLPDRERILWIDAICIDQKNEDEKNAQIPLMKNIYESATQVIIWIGTMAGNDPQGFAMLEMFKRSIEMNPRYQYDFNRNVEEGGLMPAVQHSAWTALVRVFEREWFKRTWVIQEAVRARRVWVQCGSSYVSWDVIIQVSKACQDIGYLGGYTVQSSAVGTHSAMVIDLLKNEKQKSTLINLLALTRNYEAWDKRDKVFALLGIAVDAHDFDQPKYDKTNPAQKVYLSVARRSLEKHRSLVCLSSAGLSTGERLSELPTWVPNWSNPNDYRYLMNSDRFSACGNTVPDFQICENDTTLRIRGWVIDTIASVNPWTRVRDDERINPGAIHIQQAIRVRWMRELADFDKLISTAFGGPMISARPIIQSTLKQLTKGLVPTWPVKIMKEFEEPLVRTLCCDLTPKGERAPVDRYRGGFEFWRDVFSKTNAHGQSYAILADRRLWDLHRFNAREVEHAIRTYTFGRNLCVTQGRTLAHAPHGSQRGDKIVVFKGGRVPFLVRDIGGGYSLLVGECYVHGMMDGQAMMRPGLSSSEQFFMLR